MTPDRTLGEHPFDRMLGDERAALQAVAAKDPALWKLIGNMALVAEALIGEATEIDTLTDAEGVRVFIWQSIVMYQFYALRLFLSRELDAGYTLLRNATELTRDIAAIGDDAERARRWLDYKLTDRRDPALRFDPSDSQQQAVQQLYKLCSNWGTHGHYSGLVRGETVEIVGSRHSVAVRQITDAGVREAVILWLCGYPLRSSYPNILRCSLLGPACAWWSREGRG